MSSRWRERDVKRPSSWRQALLFNSLLLLLPVMASQVISNAYNADVASDPMSVEARAETRQQIDDAFRSLSGLSGQERVTWAQRIDRTLLERDFSAARGYLLAAPLMLDKDDDLMNTCTGSATHLRSRWRWNLEFIIQQLPDLGISARWNTKVTDPIFFGDSGHCFNKRFLDCHNIRELLIYGFNVNRDATVLHVTKNSPQGPLNFV